MNQATCRGKIVYRTDGKGEEGREFFSVTVQPDGSRTLRALCEMDNDELLRDVVLSLDGAWRPLDAFVSLTIRSEFQGSAWFRFANGFVDCESFTRDTGRLSQRMATPMWPPSFGGHPVCCDTWHAKAAALCRDGDAPNQAVEGIAMSSPLPNGGSGPMLSFTDVDIEFCGSETITTPAGTFDTVHVKNYNRRRGRAHQVEIWAWSDDFVPVRARWDLLGQTYELVELEHTGR